MSSAKQALISILKHGIWLTVPAYQKDNNKAPLEQWLQEISIVKN